MLESGRALVLFLVAACPIIWFWHLWLFTDAPWLHPELLGTAAYIWNFPESATFWNLFRKIFDWKAFDPNVNRIRPLNDVFEVIDAVARPYLSKWVGPHPSLTPSALLTALLAPTALYAWLRRVTGQCLPAIVLCTIFIASIGFLSVTLPYIRPAKKLTLILLCAGLLFAERYNNRRKVVDFAALWLCLLASLFSDELGMANFLVIGLLYWPALLSRQRFGIALLFLSLPVLFLAVAKWVLPAIYLRFSVHGQWDALADARKFEVFAYLLEPRFYVAAAIQTARSILSTIGVETHSPTSQAAALMALAAAPALHGWHWRLRRIRALAQDRFILSTVVLVTTSFYATLLDWYPFPYEVSYLGSFNYYYHSSVVIPVIMWLAFGWHSLFRALASDRIHCRALLGVSTLAVGLTVVPLNFIAFEKINYLVQVIHLYPFTSTSLAGALNHLALAENRRGPVAVVVPTDRSGQERAFEDNLHKVFGRRWQENGYHQVFEMVKRNPIMTRAHIDHLLRAFYPFMQVHVSVK